MSSPETFSFDMDATPASVKLKMLTSAVKDMEKVLIAASKSSAEGSQEALRQITALSGQYISTTELIKQLKEQVKQKDLVEKQALLEKSRLEDELHRKRVAYANGDHVQVTSQSLEMSAFNLRARMIDREIQKRRQARAELS